MLPHYSQCGGSSRGPAPQLMITTRHWVTSYQAQNTAARESAYHIHSLPAASVLLLVRKKTLKT